jgi:uncharacterized protein (TIGR02001 family)
LPNVALLLLLLLSMPLPSRADEFSTVLTFSSNYFYRGYSKSANSPTVRGNADYQFDFGYQSAYAGGWISRVDFADDAYPDHADVEFYPYLGGDFKLGEDWRLDASVARYVYAGDLFGQSSDYNEYSLSLHFSDLVSFRFGYADNFYHRGHAAYDYEISGRYPVTETIEVSAGLGYNDAAPTLEYNSLYWNAGFTWYFEYGSLDLRYVDFSHLETAQGYTGIVLPYIDPKFIISVSTGF